MSDQRYCDDWSCPEKWKCALHFVQSSDYWSMASPDEPKDFFKGERNRWGCLNFKKAPFNPTLNKAMQVQGDDARPKIPENYTGPRIVK
ncbi:hypothetical protein [Agrobacterium vitis]|uniref:hypothetical protein n=1 Tax=Agrobacterium vitis TaxID=373 RepID=UPI0008DC0311|nr:hypothetical protein [Agrobacterium vitis]MCF1498951.1 hypothetical protein [Allorhizobium sp. Av2]MUO84858.1 hypothetical protein [Agrobacterium vitis]